MQVKALSCKEEAISENDPETLQTLKWTEALSTVLWSGESKFESHGHYALQTKEK